MKKIFKTTMAFVAAVSLLSLAGCAKVQKEDINPTYDGEAVKTQFSISMPSQLSSKMASSTVQLDENISSFRGMQDIVIIPYANSTDRTTRLGNNIELNASSIIRPTTGEANAAQGIPSGRLLGNSNAVLYNDVTIPVGTSAFLFYGKATGEDGYANGALVAAGLTGEAASISFTPKPIVESVNNSKGVALATYVSSIAAAKYTGTVGGVADQDVCWYMFANSGTYGGETWFNAAMGDLYNSFTSLTPGASAYVQAAVQDLYSSVKIKTDDISVAIKNAILNAAYASDGGSGTLTFTDAINGYPGTTNNGMPDGSAVLTWSDATPKVATATTGTEGGAIANIGGLSQRMDRIVYPASLYYYVNSAVKVSGASRAADYDGTNTWDQILAKYTAGSVASTTRSVAIEDPIQYAVGRLDATINKLDYAHYYDRKGDEVIIPTEGFQLTGVLIGGQKAVNYQFEPSGSTEYAIYDSTINRTGASARVTTTVNGGTNYTLALETAANEDVYVVLEFLNAGTNATDFYGFDGVVKKGCKFYMVAQLVPDANVDGHVSGVSNTGNRVFKQDYKTIANFTFAAGSQDLNTGDSSNGVPDGWADSPAGFANAYVTIPDLRTPQLELGFSVDLHWVEGITFNYTF